MANSHGGDRHRSIPREENLLSICIRQVFINTLCSQTRVYKFDKNRKINMSAPVNIGGDWLEMTDPNTGKKYYANKTTKKTQWTYPEELNKKEEPKKEEPKKEEPVASTSTTEKPKESDKAGDDWVAKQDPSSGKTYYYNKKTNETSWVKPGSGSEWIESTDPNTGKTYYINMITRKTQWTKPEGYKPKEGQGKAVAEVAETTTTTTTTTTVTTTKTDPAPKAPEASANDRFAKIRQIRNKRDEAPKESVAEDKKPEAKPDASEDKSKEKTLKRHVSIHSFSDIDLGDIPVKEMEEWAGPISEGGLGKFNLDRKGLFNKRTTLPKILSYKKDLIKKPLLNLPHNMTSEAVQSFKNVVSFMGDRSTKKEAGGHASKLLKNTLHAPEELRDEIFCQILKQIHNNPDEESLMKGWQLLAICAGTYPPSAEFEPYVMYFCEKHKGDNKQINELALAAQKRIRATQKQGARINVPTSVEIEAVRHGDPVAIRVQKLDNTTVTVPAHSWTTVKELSRMVTHKLGLKDGTPFAIFEVSSDEEERVLDEDERVLDIIAYWQKTYDDDRAKNPKHVETYKFMYKVRLFLDFDPQDEQAVDLFYIQGVFDVVNSRYPTTEKDCAQLAALQVQERHGDFKGMTGMVTDQLATYCPKKFIETKAMEQDMEDNIIQKWSSLAGKGYTNMDARGNYLDYIGRWKIYGSTYFIVEPSSENQWPSEIVLAINAKMILVVHPHTQEFLAEYPYDKVVTWGKSRTSFVLVLGNMMESHKIIFRTDQGEEINGLVQAYVDKIVGN